MNERLRINNPFGEEVILTEIVWQEILQKHPEVKNLISEIERTVSEPDFIKESIYDSRSTLYYTFHSHVFGGKYIVVVVKSVERNYISTIYITNKPSSKGKILWTKK
ncbi:MAG: hypothetical protein KGZ58_00875 [Ignavibacteriales bacterium]|nr:hypothetical protein [Ignavibacteriales bacterium]